LNAPADGAEAECEIVDVPDGPAYPEAWLWNWIAKAPRHLLANNFRVRDDFAPALAGQRPVIVAG
jgi:hypothetical protein